MCSVSDPGPSARKRKSPDCFQFSSSDDSFWFGFDNFVGLPEPLCNNSTPISCYSGGVDSAGVTLCRDVSGPSVTPANITTSFKSSDMLRLRRGDTRELLEFERPTCNCSYCGALFWYEERTYKKVNTQSPKFGLCCGNGKIKLPFLRDSPQLLEELMDYNGNQRAKDFRYNIRLCNCLFNFTSFGAKVDKSVTNNSGPFCYRIHGETYHRIGSLIPGEGESPKFAQLYVVDTENEVKNRISALGNDTTDVAIDESLVNDLKNMFDLENKLAKVFRRARDAFKKNPDVAFALRIVAPEPKAGAQYALGNCPEVVGLIVGEEDDLAVGFEIVVQSNSGPLQKIDMHHPSYMALQYPILFPYGEDGYHKGLKLNGDWLASHGDEDKKQRERVSVAEYYRYRLQRRLFETPRILSGGKLFHQFVVDAYTCVEQYRLQFHKGHQNSLRSDLYQGLADALANGDTDTTLLGKRIILPSSFTGGPRYMQQNYQDAMAICRTYGNPDLFITFTCNANWKEFGEALETIPGQKIQDRPALISRVFKLKIDALIQYFKGKKYFGRVDAVVYTIEFQKRGLPHAHIVLWLQPSSKPNTPADIDRLISAKIPDPFVDSLGHDAVKKFMMHGPCGTYNPKCPCMKDSECTKKFPKDYNDSTYVDDQGFPVYSRPNDGVTVGRNNVLLDNRHVIPHNLDLIIKFDAHINVEWCNKSHAIKYLFKYITKGSDRARAEIRDCSGNANDEIAAYLHCRYLSAIEACWRLFEFSINHREPAVQRLQYHLPDQQTVVFSEHSSIGYIVDKAKERKSMLIAWFRANEMYECARELTYAEFPTGFVWDNEQCEWRMRQRGKSIGRMYYAHPASGDRFYLRMLLNIVKGCTSYEEIRTYNGHIYRDFREACQARGLIGDDDEWRDAIFEAYRWANGFQMRDLFSMILIHCDVACPLKLWNDTWHTLCDDIVYVKRRYLHNSDAVFSTDELQDLVLVELDMVFRRNGTSLKKRGLPKPKRRIGFDSGNDPLCEELRYDRVDQARQL